MGDQKWQPTGGWDDNGAPVVYQEAAVPEQDEAIRLLGEAVNALEWCDLRYKQTLASKPVGDVPELRAYVARTLTDARRFLTTPPPATPAALDVERLAEAWFVGIQHKSGRSADEALARWNDGSEDMEYMRGKYLSVARIALARLATPEAEPLTIEELQQDGAQE